MTLIRLLAKLPIDLGQAEYKHSTKGKQIAFSYLPRPTGSARALDIGCGDGYWSEKLKFLGYTTTAIDQERDYPNIDAATRHQSMLPINLNQPLPFANESFDTVWCSEVIEFLPNYQQVTHEMLRILKPGGTYVVTIPNSYFWLHYFLKLFGLNHRDWQNPGHVIFFHLNDIKKLFPQATVCGYFPYTFVKFKIKHWLSLLSPTFVIVGKKP